MILVVSNNKRIKAYDGFKTIEVDEAKQMIESWPVVQFDTETTGLDTHLSELISMQFGYKDFSTGKSTQIVVDTKSISTTYFKDILEGKWLIGHNLKFDLKMLYSYGIVPRHVYDTMICEETLYLGHTSKTVSFNLHDVVLRHTGKNMDKTMQRYISITGLSSEGIKYAANDVIHLQDVRKSQIEKATTMNCLGALALENSFVPAIAYLEWCGIHLDENKWKAKMEEDKKKYDTSLAAINQYVLSDPKLERFTSTSAEEPSLFSAPTTTSERVCNINWNSPPQVADVLKTIGFNVTVVDSDGKEKESTLEETLVCQKGIADDFLEDYLEYKEAAKEVSTYGQGYLYQVNPVTGRIHTDFKQIGTITGRLSCGNKKPNKQLAALKHLDATSVTHCNLQNLPSNDRTRSCFTAEPGNIFVSCDYSAEESRVQADVWNEKSLLDSFEHGIDTHNLYAKMCFPDELADVDVKDVKKVRPDLRQAAKSAEFAVGYGSDGTSISQKLGIPKEKAREMVSGILKGMTGMSEFRRKTAKFLKDKGYIVISQKTGHRLYWPGWGKWLAEEAKYTPDFWNDYQLYHKGTKDSVCKAVRRHKNEKIEWLHRKVLNGPIQGGSAIVLKQAATDLFNWIVDNGYFGKIKFCVFVHDEIDCECPEELKDIFPKKMEEIMEKAAAKYYTKLPIPATCEVDKCWKH